MAFGWRVDVRSLQRSEEGNRRSQRPEGSAVFAPRENWRAQSCCAKASMHSERKAASISLSSRWGSLIASTASRIPSG